MNIHRNSTDELADVIQRKHACLTRLLELSVRQTELIEARDMNALMRLLGTKQHLITTLQQVEQELDPYRNGDPEIRVWTSPDVRAACAKQADACKALLSEIVEMERRNEQQMQQQQAHTAERLQQAHAASRARAAYRAHA